MKYNGRIEDLNHIVISDPSYEKGTWCRYEIDNLKEKNCLVELEINKVQSEFEEGADFSLLLKKYNDDCSIKNEGIEYQRDIEIKNYNIGMDTACIALGINNHAKEINDSQSEWQPDCSIRTGTDGYLGEVTEGKRENDLVFVYISGYLSLDIDYDMDEFTEYLISQFQIKEISKGNFVGDSCFEGDM